MQKNFDNLVKKSTDRIKFDENQDPLLDCLDLLNLQEIQIKTNAVNFDVKNKRNMQTLRARRGGRNIKKLKQLRKSKSISFFKGSEANWNLEAREVTKKMNIARAQMHRLQQRRSLS